jgi:hypothetical protein
VTAVDLEQEAAPDGEAVQETQETSGEAGDTRSRRRIPGPILVVGLAFAAGVVLAKVLAWKSDVRARD